MDCKEIQELLSSYLDHELDLMRSLEVEQHVKNCVACSEKWKAHQSLHNIFSEGSLYQTAPVALRDRVRSSLRPDIVKERKSVLRWQWLAYAASFTIVFLLGWMIGHPRTSSSISLNEEILSSHVRALMPGHLTDVVSSDQHTVKPWFNGKLDFSPPVKDLAGEGFPLIGGRLDYLNHRTVPVLIYKRHNHIINLYLWPASENANSEPRLTMLQGYHIIEWVGSGMSQYAISDLNEKELRDFVTLLRRK